MSILPRGNRVVLCRPLGGLNDLLCQVQKAWSFAEKTGRDLILDTRESGLLTDWDRFFVSLDHGSLDNRVAVTPRLSDSEYESLESLTCSPEWLEGRLRRFFSLTLEQRAAEMGEQVLPAIRLPAEDPSTELVVHHQRGGGNQSRKLLRRIRVTDDIRTELIKRTRDLPAHYVAAHIRATDYTTQGEGFLRRLRRVARGLPVFIATDNPHVRDLARDLFAPGQLITFDDPELVPAGVPLHEVDRYQSEADKVEATTRVLRDLFVASRADQFCYTYIDQPGKFGELRASGLSRLAAYLTDHPEVRESFFATGDAPVSGRGRSQLLAPLHQRLRGVLGQRRARHER